MRGRHAPFIFFFAAFISTVSAMSVAKPQPLSNCRVVNEGKLPASFGGADLICGEVQRAMAAQAPGVQYSAEIKVISASRLSAALVVDGRPLPLQNFAVMDRNLSVETIRHFANAIVLAVVQAARSTQ